MLAYAFRRILQAVPVLLGVTLLVSFLVNIIPGDPATSMVGEAVTPEILQAIRDRFALDQPFLVQWWRFLKRMVQLDFGHSFITGDAIGPSFAARLPYTALLAFSAMLYATILGVTLGTLSALYRNSWIDRACSVFVVAGISMPVFFLGLLLLFVFTVKLGWVSGRGFDSPLSLILPALTLGTQSAALIARVTRSSVLDTLSLEHVVFARAKGMPEYKVILRHVLYNAALPVFTVVLLDLGSYLSGSVITETIFGWPGIGSYMYHEGIERRDFPVIQASVFFCATLFLALNLVTDLLYALFDPRIRDEVTAGGR